MKRRLRPPTQCCSASWRNIFQSISEDTCSQAGDAILLFPWERHARISLSSGENLEDGLRNRMGFRFMGIFAANFFYCLFIYYIIILVNCFYLNGQVILTAMIEGRRKRHGKIIRREKRVSKTGTVRIREPE